MFTLNQYTDLLSENITKLSDNTGIVSCAQVFVQDVQNANIKLSVLDSGHFELSFEYDGQNYILRCNKVNGKVGITGFYRSGSNDEDIVDINMSTLDSLRCLNTRNLYNCTINKILDILHSQSESDSDI